MQEQKKRQLRHFLEGALDDSLDVTAFRNFVTQMPKDLDELVNNAAHQLLHFISDADLRSVDADYDQRSRDAIRKYLDDFGPRS